MDCFAYCDAFVRKHDEDRWLAARYAAQGPRRSLLALYAVQIEIGRAPRLVREAPLGEIRLQWWGDRLSDIAAGKPAANHPVLQAYASQGLAAETLQALLVAIEAQSRVLHDPFVSVEDFARWLMRTEGALAVAAARLVSDAEVPGAADAAVAFAMARAGRRCVNAFFADIAPEARLRMAAAKATVTAAAMPAIAQCALTEDYLRSPAPGALGKRLKILAAIVRGRL